MGRQYERFGSWDYDKNYDGVMAKYHQQIYAIDVAVGMIRDALNEREVADNTVIITLRTMGFCAVRTGTARRCCPTRKPRACRC